MISPKIQAGLLAACCLCTPGYGQDPDYDESMSEQDPREVDRYPSWFERPPYPGTATGVWLSHESGAAYYASLRQRFRAMEQLRRNKKASLRREHRNQCKAAAKARHEENRQRLELRRLRDEFKAAGLEEEAAETNRLIAELGLPTQPSLIE